MPARRLRDAELARPRAKSEPQTDHGTAIAATVPQPDPDWHTIARQMWDSCLESGQAAFWQSSDYALCYMLCNELSRYLSPRYDARSKTEVPSKISGHFVSMLLDGFRDLLVSEGARRRLRIELDLPEPEADTSMWTIVRLAHLERKGETLSTEDRELLEANRHRLAS